MTLASPTTRSDADRLELRRFPAVGTGQPGHEAASAWLRAVGLGFYDPRRTATQIDTVLASYALDSRQLTGIYQTGPMAEHSLPADIPIATFASLRKNLNIGGGKQLPAHLITAVTVRTSHRRQGLLRRMMSEDLQRAADDGVAVAALMASEAGIYGRYGFGAATFERSVTVDTSARFRFREPVRERVEVVDRQVLLDVAPTVFGLVQRAMPGSIDRQDIYRHRICGNLGAEGKPDETVRAALHYGPDGRVDGYVSYKFGGWDATPPTMDVLDLIAATPEAYLGLWQFLGSIDLVERVTWSQAPAEDPLAWALVDGRCVQETEVRDMLWLRILDVQAALRARQYSADGRLVIGIHDPLGITDGAVALTVVNGQASVTAAAGEEPDISLDVDALGSLYLGGVSPVTLVEAGRIQEHGAGAARTALGMFAVERFPRCQTHF